MPIPNCMTRTSAKAPSRAPSRSRAEFLARAKAFQGKPLNWFDPKSVIACVVGTVNAPYRERLSAEELAEALRTGKVELPQVESFFLEMDLDAQRIFAAELGVPEGALRRTAENYAEYSNRDVPLLDS